MLREALYYLRRQIFLGSFVGSSYRVSFLFVFDLDIDLPPKVLHQDTPSSSGNLDRVRFNLFSLGFVPKLQSNTILI